MVHVSQYFWWMAIGDDPQQPLALSESKNRKFVWFDIVTGDYFALSQCTRLTGGLGQTGGQMERPTDFP